MLQRNEALKPYWQFVCTSTGGLKQLTCSLKSARVGPVKLVSFLFFLSPLM